MRHDRRPPPQPGTVGSGLAMRWGAPPIDLHALEAPPIHPGIGMHVPPSTFEIVHAAQAEIAKAVERVFAKRTACDDVRAGWRLLGTEPVPGRIAGPRARARPTSPSWRRPTGGAERGGVQRHPHEVVIRRGGRPVLLLPPEEDDAPAGARALVGWAETPECAPAVHDLLPLLTPGATVHLVAIDGERRAGEEGDTMTEMAAALDRHGLTAEIARVPRGGRGTAEALQDEAFESGGHAGGRRLRPCPGLRRRAGRRLGRPLARVADAGPVLALSAER